MYLYEERKARIQEYEKVAKRTINWLIVTMIALAWFYFFRTKIAEFLVIAFFIIFVGTYAKCFFCITQFLKKIRKRGNRYAWKL